MKQYLVSPHAVELSEAVQLLSRPLSVRADHEVTTARYGSVLGTDDRLYLILDDEDLLPVHEKADTAAVMSLLSHAVTGDAATALRNSLEAARGGSLRVWDVVPDAMKAGARDYGEMIAAGLLAQPVTP